ncbi:MAG: hypothetical protein ACREJ0_23680, partial [Geminicoccaceae bacterium]
MVLTREEVLKGLAGVGYVAEPQLAMAIALMQRLQRLLLLEGEAGVGKTEVQGSRPHARVAGVPRARADGPAADGGVRAHRVALVSRVTTFARNRRRFGRLPARGFDRLNAGCR